MHYSSYESSDRFSFDSNYVTAFCSSKALDTGTNSFSMIWSVLDVWVAISTECTPCAALEVWPCPAKKELRLVYISLLCYAGRITWAVLSSFHRDFWCTGGDNLGLFFDWFILLEFIAVFTRLLLLGGDFLYLWLPALPRKVLAERWYLTERSLISCPFPKVSKNFYC